MAQRREDGHEQDDENADGPPERLGLTAGGQRDDRQHLHVLRQGYPGLVRLPESPAAGVSDAPLPGGVAPYGASFHPERGTTGLMGPVVRCDR